MNKTAVFAATDIPEQALLGAWGKELTLSRLESGVGLLTLSVPGRANTLTSEVIEYMDRAINLACESDLKALIFTSGKPDIFLAGADIKELLMIKAVEDVHKLAQRGHAVFKRVLELPIATVSAVHGLCLGGGLEFILCSDRRLVSDAPHTLIGLPEVTIGLIPGLGGTQRLMAQIGLKNTLDLILSGVPKSAQEALSIGLIDEIIPADKLLERAEELALSLSQAKINRSQERDWRSKKMEEEDGGREKRAAILKTSERVIRIKTGGHYPAPKLALDVIRVGLNEGIEKGLEAEIDGFAKMAVSSIAKNMISVYFTREMAAQTAKRAMDKFGAIDSLGIIGSGSMGKGIAEIASQSGMDLLVRSSSKEKSQIEVERLKKRLSENCTDKMVKASDNFQDFANLDMVVESVYEDLELKKQIIEKVSRHMSKDAILATNTSSFSIKELAQFSEKPENLLGLHFFYPVDRMPLVEIIAHDKCSPAIEKKAIAFVGQLGKVPILVKDSPGFLVNRLLCAFLLEATRILDEGVPLNWIDSVATKFGMPMGPFELCDELGWGLTTSVAKLLHSKFGKRLEPPSLMERALAMGLDGKKTNAGCYYWEDSTRKIGLNDEFIKQAGVCMSDQLVDETSAIKIRDRLFLPMIDEAARCLEERVVRKARDIDLAIIVGAGFPPFRGGLLRYADELGIEYLVEHLSEIYSTKQPKRSISNMIQDMNKTGRKFYSLN